MSTPLQPPRIIERNREALKRIAAQLLDMAGLDMKDGQSGTGTRDAASPTPDCRLPTAAKLPRHLYLFILRLLRPAEAAARRLIIAAARGLVVPVPKPPRRPEPKPQTNEPILRKLGLAVMVSRGDLSPAARRAKAKAGAKPSARQTLSLPLFDPPRRLNLHGRRRRTTPPHAAPRICVPGFTELRPLPKPPSPDDRINALRLGQRIAALAAALDDLPGQARRFARWKARRDAGFENRTWPIRRGRPPGGRLTRWDPDAQSGDAQGRRSPRNIREIDEILAHAHSPALYTLEYPDTS